jgi:hypothetical protein
MPGVHVIADGTVVVTRMEPRMVLMNIHVSMALDVPVDVPMRWSMVLRLVCGACRRRSILIARFGDYRPRHQGRDKCGSKNAFHRDLLRWLFSTTAPIFIKGADRCLNESSQVTFRSLASVRRAASIRRASVPGRQSGDEHRSARLLPY